MSQEYDLKKSKEGIGQLYPILEAKDGEIIDGVHREQADKDWKRVRLEHIDSEEKKLVARLVSNKQVESKEQVNYDCINGLAEIYLRNGIPSTSLAKKIEKVTGFGQTTVYEYLSSKYKDAEKSASGAKAKGHARVPASQVIISRAGGGDEDYGERLVERHREEVIAEEKPKIEKEVREKLLQNKDFIVDVVSRAPEILEKISEPEPPPLSKEEIERATKAIEKAEKELSEKQEKPEIKKRGILVKNWMAHTEVVGFADSLCCPICGSGLDELVWKCHDVNVVSAHKMLKERLEG